MVNGRLPLVLILKCDGLCLNDVYHHVESLQINDLWGLRLLRLFHVVKAKAQAIPKKGFCSWFSHEFVLFCRLN